MMIILLIGIPLLIGEFWLGSWSQENKNSVKNN
jgi:SNF family Na+-dependent transporter